MEVVIYFRCMTCEEMNKSYLGTPGYLVQVETLLGLNDALEHINQTGHYVVIIQRQKE